MQEYDEVHTNRMTTVSGSHAPPSWATRILAGRAQALSKPASMLGPALAGLLQVFQLKLAAPPGSVADNWLPLVQTALMLTPAEAAKRVGISLSLIYQLCAEKRLPHYRIGGEGRRGKVLIAEKDLDTFLSDCRVDASDVDESEPLKHIR